MTHSLRTAAAALLLLGAAGAAHALEPASRPLAGTPAQSRAVLKDQPRTPAPVVNVLTASLDAQGRVSVRCTDAENPAFRAWRERLSRDGGQER